MKPKQQPAEVSTGKPGPRAAKSKRAKQQQEIDHPLFQPNAAGIDIGEPGRSTSPYRVTIPFESTRLSPAICTKWRSGWSVAVLPR